MSGRVRWAVAGVVVVAAGSLLLAADWAVPLVAASAFALLAILHGNATGCPACGKWWSRVVVKKDLVSRGASDETGAPYERSVDRTTYRCAGCGHVWSVTDTEGDQEPGRGRPQPHGGVSESLPP
jgi:hypothetical protein